MRRDDTAFAAMTASVLALLLGAAISQHRLTADVALAASNTVKLVAPGDGLPKKLDVRRVLEPRGTVWHRSVSLPGALRNGVLLPGAGPTFVTEDAVSGAHPSSSNRRWGNDRLIRFLLDVFSSYRLAHPKAARLVVGDLSLPGGGPFGSHGLHRNGLDADIYMPRRDGLERAPTSGGQVDPGRADELAGRFLKAGAEWVMVSPGVGVRSRPGIRFGGGHTTHLHVHLADR
jgi:hypothetical protein